MSVGKIIKFLRCEKGLTQEELADLLEVKKSSIQKYEANDVPNIKISTIRKLSSLFNISASAFIFPENYRNVDIKSIVKFNDDLQNHHIVLTQKLNEAGRKKVFEYARDLVDSGNYEIISGQDETR